MADANDLSALEPWLAGYMARLEPAQRMLLSRRVGKIVRDLNAARVIANIEPDGASMAPRKPKKQRPPKHARAGRIPVRQRGKKGAMFKRIELARNMQVRAGADMVELNFKPRVAETAAVHHFGEMAPVDPRIPNSIRIRYTARRLLGFGAGDSDAILAAVMAYMDTGAV